MLAQLAALRCTIFERSPCSRFARDRLLSALLAVLALFFALSAHGDQAVAVRTGLHDGFGRLVLEWPAPVAVTGHQEGSRYRLRFERPLEVVLDAAVARLDDFLASARLDADGRELTFDLKPGVAVRQHVFKGRIVVLDLAHAAGSEEVEVRAGLHDGFGRIVFDWPVPITFDALTTDRQVSIRFSRAGDIDATGPTARLAAWLANASASRSEDRSEVRLVLQPGVTARVFQVDDNRVAVDLSALPARPAEGGAAAEVQRAASARPSTVSALAPQPDPAALPPDHTPSADLTIAPGAGDGGALLDFAWTGPVPAAVFVRGANLWVVFAAETSQREHLAVPSALRDYIGEGEPIEASSGTAIRFALHRPLSAEVRREDRIWRVRLSADAPRPRPLVPLRLASPARLRLAPGETPRLVGVRDPDTGERLTVWPLLQPNLGQPRQSFVELELLATAQGLAWRPRSDHLHARIVAQAVEFDAPGGLALSESAGNEPSPPTISAGSPVSEVAAPAVATGPPGETAAGAPAAAAPMPAAQAARAPEPPPLEPPGARAGAPALLLGLVGWGLDPTRTAPEQRGALLQALAQAAPDERDAHRLELARYYLSKGLAAEALGVLGAVETSAEEATRVARQALTGAAELLLDRIDAGAAALGAALFDADPEVALWRCAAAASRQDWPQAARELERSEQILATYPQALRLRLGLAVATTAIETGDTGLAATLLDQLETLDLSPGERARVAFLSGLASAQNGAIEAADETWRPLEHDGPVEVRIRAAFARTELLLGAGQLDPAEAIARLAATRGLWPGHPWEERMLGGLAQIYSDAGDRASALRTWRELLDRFPDTADAPAIAERMREALIETLRAEGEAELGPVPAFALFREFEQLIPHDQLGDGLRRRMAGRLAELDLIGPAASLLEALIRDRLEGIGKATAGADLAELWLREPAPEAALSALERSRVQTALPPDLDQRRRVLAADALARLERRSAALALLDGVGTRAADHLRVAILRQEQDWPRVVSAIERFLERRDDPGAPLAQHEQVMVLELALAHRRLGDGAALAQLRTRFAAALRGLASEPGFLLATSAPATAADPDSVLAVAEQHLRGVRGYLDAERATN